MAKFVSITAILSHEHEVRFKDGTELRQAHRAGFSHPTFTAGGHQGKLVVSSMRFTVRSTSLYLTDCER